MKNNIRQFRTSLERWLWFNRISQVTLARELNLSRQQINDWVSGRTTPGKRNAARIAQFTGGQVSELELLYPERITPAQLTVTITPDACACQ